MSIQNFMLPTNEEEEGTHNNSCLELLPYLYKNTHNDSTNPRTYLNATLNFEGFKMIDSIERKLEQKQERI